MFPVLQTPYPIAQKCLPQYFLLICGNSSCIRLDVLPLSFLTISLMVLLGRYSICRCTWSELTTPDSMIISYASQICLISVLHLLFSSPSRTLYRYFVTQTMCAVSLETVCPLYLCLFSTD
jgi:hypothetical protein